MDPILARPSPAPERSAEEMLGELRRLDEALQRKLAAEEPSLRARYEAELVPKLDEVTRLVEGENTIAKNAIEDAIVAFREALTKPQG